MTPRKCASPTLAGLKARATSTMTSLARREGNPGGPPTRAYWQPILGRVLS